jgi:hypothetical protein
MNTACLSHGNAPGAPARQLQDEGANPLVNSWHELMDVIAGKSAAALAKAS